MCAKITRAFFVPRLFVNYLLMFKWSYERTRDLGKKGQERGILDVDNVKESDLHREHKNTERALLRKEAMDDSVCHSSRLSVGTSIDLIYSMLVPGFCSLANSYLQVDCYLSLEKEQDGQESEARACWYRLHCAYQRVSRTRKLTHAHPHDVIHRTSNRISKGSVMLYKYYIKLKYEVRRDDSAKRYTNEICRDNHIYM